MLAVANGRLVMSRADSGASYPGTTIKKTLGAWPNASAVEVRGGTLVVEHEAAFGASTEILASGGTIELAEGVILPAAAIRVTDGAGGWTELRGTCGGLTHVHQVSWQTLNHSPPSFASTHGHGFA